MFPRSNVTGYYADMTRTFVKGVPSAQLVRQYEAVQTVQAEAVNMVNVGTACKAVYTHCVERFKQLGFITTMEEGFTHSTGHGIGLGLHEAPRLGNNDVILKAGMAVTVEPGLYYKAVGGVRIEDVVVLHTDGTPENINTYSKDWIIS
jgi:Xaa-Pro aminopeptidase